MKKVSMTVADNKVLCRSKRGAGRGAGAPVPAEVAACGA